MASRENVTLEVHWNVQPWVGALTWTLKEAKSFGRWRGIDGGRSSVFGIPALKGKSNAASGGQEQPVRPPPPEKKPKPKAAEASPVI